MGGPGFSEVILLALLVYTIRGYVGGSHDWCWYCTGFQMGW